MRRTAQLRRLHPHLAFESVRGNINTRLDKLDREGSQYAAIILAAAGLLRIDMGHRISAYLSSGDGDGDGDGRGANTPAAESDTSPSQQSQQTQTQTQSHDAQPTSEPSQNTTLTAPPPAQRAPSSEQWGMLYAVGQGALALEMREGDARVQGLLAALHDTTTALACLAERSLMRTLEGGCSVPIGVETSWGGSSSSSSSTSSSLPSASAADNNGGAAKEAAKELTMLATVVSIDGSQASCARYTATVATEEAADEFGREVARRLISDGADRILAGINLDRGVIAEEGGA